MSDKRNAVLEELKLKMPTCFGDQDKIFAGHPFDEQRAKELRKLAFDNSISLKEVEDIARQYLVKEGCISEHIQEQMQEVRTFFSKKLRP